MLEINIQQPDPFSLSQPPLSPFSLRTFPSREECQTLGFDPFSVPEILSLTYPERRHVLTVDRIGFDDRCSHKFVKNLTS